MSKINSKTNVILYLSGNFLSALIPFIAIPYIASKLGPSEYGEVGIFFAFVAFFNCIIGLNSIGLQMKMHHTVDQNSERVILATYLVFILTVILTIAGLYLLKDAISHLIIIDYDWMYLAVICSSSMYLVNALLGYYQMKSRAKIYVLLQTIQVVAYTTAAIILVRLGFGSEGRVYGHSAVAVIFGLVCGYTAIRSMRKCVKIAYAEIKKVLEFGTPLILHSLSIFAITQLDKLYLAHYLHKEAVGVYILAYQMSTVVSYIFDATLKAYIKKLYIMIDSGYLKKNFKKSIAIIMIFSLCSVIVVGFIIVNFVWEFFGSEYEDGKRYFAILVLSQAFHAIYLYGSAIVFYMLKTKVMAYITFGSSVLNLFGIYMAVPQFGLIGAAMSVFLVVTLRAALVTMYASICINHTNVGT